jgi:beta-galactosidase
MPPSNLISRLLVFSSVYRAGFVLVLSAILWGGSMASGVAATREDRVLADGWKFIKEDAGLTAATDNWEAVTLPHTWNTVSADQGDHKKDPHYKNGYYRGACWYARTIDAPAGWQGKRVFLRFEAASLVARTYLNGQELGEHRGGFTAFCYELTSLLRPGANELRVQVDNSGQKDVAPLAGDFNVDGGLYRPVHLIVTDPVCISPLDRASPGVFLITKSLNDSAAQIQVETLVSNGKTSPVQVQVKTDIADASGAIVATRTQPASVEAGKTEPILTNLNIPSPHRWNGRKDPYLYTATVSLLADGGISDSINQPLGLRTVAISEQQGFLLNGKPYPIHGVNRHQDWGDKGWAASAADFDEDARIMLDMGVTAIRLAHYPQSDYLHKLCDHNGILLWNEIPLVNLISDKPEFAANAEQQLREMILQRYNHPSVAFWGLFNELGLSSTPAPDALLQHLKAVAQELDPARLIVCAIYGGHRTYDTIADHPCFNRYPGWYAGLNDVDSFLQKDSAEAGKRIAFSEYGAGANPAPDEQHEGPLTQKRADRIHSEQWQVHVHEVLWDRFKDDPRLWGTFAWCMFDFQSARRQEGGFVGVNDKGLVTEDRKIKKDAYFFYQANWTDKPMVHIASSRLTPRRQTITPVEVFSNCDKVALSVNGSPLEPVSPDDVRVFRWPAVTLRPGKNEIKAIATTSQGELTDSCEWVVDPSAVQPALSPETIPPKPAQ